MVGCADVENQEPGAGLPMGLRVSDSGNVWRVILPYGTGLSTFTTSYFAQASDWERIGWSVYDAIPSYRRFHGRDWTDADWTFNVPVNRDGDLRDGIEIGVEVGVSFWRPDQGSVNYRGIITALYRRNNSIQVTEDGLIVNIWRIYDDELIQDVFRMSNIGEVSRQYRDGQLRTITIGSARIYFFE